MGFAGNIVRDRALLGSLLERLELPISLASPLLAHARAVQRDAARLGLVSPRDVASVVSRHSADSLLFALVRKPRRGERWIDVGAGAGFPGLVLAIAFPETSFTLAEPLRKRAGFLDSVAAEVGVANVDITTSRAEDIRADFDVAVARALADPVTTLDRLPALLLPGGCAIVAVGGGYAPSGAAEVVRLKDLGDVDSPGVFSMMTREV